MKFLSLKKEKKLIICCTSLEKRMRETIKIIVEKLGAIFQEYLTFETKILVAGSVISDKYRLASLLDIPVVNTKWIEASMQKKEFQPTEEYRVKIFLGATLGVFGFTLEDCREIRSIIEEENGTFVDSLESIISNKVHVNLLIIKSNQIRTYEDFLNGSQIPAVTEEWLRQCLVRRLYVKIDSYLIRKNSSEENEYHKQQSEIKVLLTTEKDLSKYFREIENDDEGHLFFSDCVFCFHKLSPQLESFLIKLTNLGGGTYSREVLLSTTHIIAEFYTENDLLIFKKYNTFVHIMKPFWIKDCYDFKRKIFENDYYQLPSTIQLAKDGVLGSKPAFQGLGTNSRAMKFSADDASLRPGLQNLNEDLYKRGKSVGGYELAQRSKLINDKTPQMNKPVIKSGEKKARQKATPTKSPRSHPENSSLEHTKKPSVSPLKRDIQITIKTCLFNQIYFYIDREYQKELHSYRVKVLENGGKYLEKPQIIIQKDQEKELYYIIKDSPDFLEKKKKTQTEYPNSKIIYVSHRWIDFCLEKKFVALDLTKKNQMHLMPFPCVTPISDFKNLVICSSGFQMQEKIMLSNFLQVFGSRTLQDRTKLFNLNYLICENTNSKKFKEIMETEKCMHIKIMKTSWIFECMKAGRKIPEEGFEFVERT